MAGGRWEKIDEIPFADMLTTRLIGYTVDGKTQYIIDSRGRNTSALIAVDTSSGQKTLLHEDSRADIDGNWENPKMGVLEDPKTGKLQAVATNYFKKRWVTLDPAIDADIRTLQGIGSGAISVRSRTLDGKVWIVAYSSAQSPDVYYRYVRGNKPEKIFSSRPMLDGAPLVPMWPREIKSRDGLTLVSYLTLPIAADLNIDGKADSPMPMVLLVHGGPWWRDVYGYRSLSQWLANRGYAVLSVNYRGSIGFGKDFVNKADGESGGKMHDDLIDAVNWAVDQKITNKGQVAIMGTSYGGYAALVGMTFTPDTFKCGVDIVGPSNLVTLFSTFPAYWASSMMDWYRRVGDPRTEAGKKLLIERSPLSRVAAIKNPLLIGQGANDPRVKQAESDQIVQAMKAKNIPVTYVLFPDEGHGFMRPENSKAFNAVAEGFLGQCLGGRVQPIGEDFRESSITVPEGAYRIPDVAEAMKSHAQAIRK